MAGPAVVAVGPAAATHERRCVVKHLPHGLFLQIGIQTLLLLHQHLYFNASHGPCCGTSAGQCTPLIDLPGGNGQHPRIPFCETMTLMMKTWTSSTWPLSSSGLHTSFFPLTGSPPARCCPSCKLWFRKPVSLADTPLESWVPLWVGHGESPSAREALVKQWRRTDQLDTARFLSLVSNFCSLTPWSASSSFRTSLLISCF